MASDTSWRRVVFTNQKRVTMLAAQALDVDDSHLFVYPADAVNHVYTRWFVRFFTAKVDDIEKDCESREFLVVYDRRFRDGFALEEV